MTNVLHVIETGGPGGAETIFLELATGLDQTRFATRCAVPYSGWLSAALESHGVEPIVVRTRRGRFDWPLFADLIRLIRVHRIGLVQSHLFGANLYSSLTGRLLGVPVVSTFHGLVDLGAHNRLTRLKWRLVSAGSHVVFVSNALRSAFAAVGLAPAASTVIPNGVDTDAFAPDPNPRLRAELRVGPDAVLIGAVGNIRPAKSYDVLLRVAAACRDDPRLVFIVAGEASPALSPGLDALARDLGVADRVRFLGLRSDVAQLLNACDVCLNTSSSEGFSLTCVQAMACGVPVVATRSGGPEEIVTDQRDGLLVPVGDVAGIAGAVRALAADPERRHALGAAGRQAAVERFGVRKMIEAYAEVYEMMLRPA